MWFLVRMAFWLSLVLVLLPFGSSQPVPESQVSAGDAFTAARSAVADVQSFCERQREACAIGSQTAVTLGQRAQAGAKMLYELLQVWLDEAPADQPTTTTGSTTGSVSALATPSQHTLRPADLVPEWRGPQAGTRGAPRA